MSTSSIYPREEALLGFCPLSFLDNVEQIIDDYLADGVDALEENLIEVLGLNKELLSETEKEKLRLCLSQCGDKFLRVLREHFDKNLDKFEIYCLRNIFTLSEDIKLEHVQEFVKRNIPLGVLGDEKQDEDEMETEGEGGTHKKATKGDIENDNSASGDGERNGNADLNNIERQKENIPDINIVEENDLVKYLDGKNHKSITSQDEDIIDNDLDELRNKLRKVRRRKERVISYLEQSKEYATTMEEGASSITSSKKELENCNADSLHDSITLLVQQEREFSQLSNLSQNLRDALIGGPGGQLDVDILQQNKRVRYNQGNEQNSNTEKGNNNNNSNMRKGENYKNNSMFNFNTSLLFTSTGRRSSLARSQSRSNSVLDFQGGSSSFSTASSRRKSGVMDGISDIHIRNKTDVHSLIAALTGK